MEPTVASTAPALDLALQPSVPLQAAVEDLALGVVWPMLRRLEIERKNLQDLAWHHESARRALQSRKRPRPLQQEDAEAHYAQTLSLLRQAVQHPCGECVHIADCLRTHKADAHRALMTVRGFCRRRFRAKAYVAYVNGEGDPRDIIATLNHRELIGLVRYRILETAGRLENVIAEMCCAVAWSARVLAVDRSSLAWAGLLRRVQSLEDLLGPLPPTVEGAVARIREVETIVFSFMREAQALH